ncbi:MAG: hypothetical protein V3R99_04285 [Thermoguttaceae bacterium]
MKRATWLASAAVLLVVAMVVSMGPELTDARAAWRPRLPWRLDRLFFDDRLQCDVLGDAVPCDSEALVVEILEEELPDAWDPISPIELCRWERGECEPEYSPASLLLEADPLLSSDVLLGDEDFVDCCDLLDCCQVESFEPVFSEIEYVEAVPSENYGLAGYGDHGAGGYGAGGYGAGSYGAGSYGAGSYGGYGGYGGGGYGGYGGGGGGGGKGDGGGGGGGKGDGGGGGGGKPIPEPATVVVWLGLILCVAIGYHRRKR